MARSRGRWQACYQQLHHWKRSLVHLLFNLSNCPAPQNLQSMNQRVEFIKLQDVRPENVLFHIKMPPFRLFNSMFKYAIDMDAYTCAVVPTTPYCLSLSHFTLLHILPGSAGISVYTLWLLQPIHLWMHGGGGSMSKA